MSWYSLGGFSAYLIEPSGRWRNHCGCSRTHGWSGEHWIAKSSATSIPRRLAAELKRSKSPSVPIDGSIAVCPPASLPIAHGLPGELDPPFSELPGPLRLV